MWSAYDGQCDPAKSTRAFADRAPRGRRHDAHRHARARIDERDGGVRGVQTTKGYIEAGAVVVTRRRMDAALVGTAGVDVPIMPVIHGQAETQPGRRARSRPTLRAFGFGFRQRPDGRLVLSAGINARVEHRVTLADTRASGSGPPATCATAATCACGSIRRSRCANCATARASRPRTSPSPPSRRRPSRDIDAALVALKRALPALSGLRIERYWSGLLDVSPDGLPIIDHGPARTASCSSPGSAATGWRSAR